MSKADFELEASPRQDVGKGASRRLRRLADEIPAIIYGAGKEPEAITLKHKDIARAILNESFFSQILTIKLGSNKESVVIKDLQRHPAKPRVMHADFFRVSADQAISVKIPLHFINEDECPGVKIEGGQINHLINELDVSCLPKDLPEYIEVDMLMLNLGDSIHISDITLPQGVTSVDLTHGDENDLAVAAVNKSRAEEEPVDAVSDDVEAAEGDSGTTESSEESTGDKSADAGGDDSAGDDENAE